MIYLDNAATTIHKPETVIEAVTEAMRHVGNSARGTHAGSLDAARIIFETRMKIASLFGCPDPTRVAFTCNITESLNIAINGLFSEGDHVITTMLEHNSVLRPLYRLEKERGIELSIVPADENGCICYDDFEKMIRPNTRAIVTTHISNLTGNMLDIARIGKIAHAHDLLYIVDAAQSAGNILIDMAAMDIDVLCFTGHKGLYGPQGTGGLCVMPGVQIRPFKVGGTGVQTYLKKQPEDMPVRLEAGTMNAHGLAGLSAAVDFINEAGVEEIHRHEMELMQLFYKEVKEIDGVTVYGDFSGDRGAIVTINIRDYDSSEVSDCLMQDYEIATRPGAHCAPLMHEALGTTDQGAVRFSFSWFNTKDEVLDAIKAVRELSE